MKQWCHDAFGIDVLNVSQGKPTSLGISIMGQILVPVLVQVARQKDMEYFMSNLVWVNKLVKGAQWGRQLLP